jgi:hypothetical protein
MAVRRHIGPVMVMMTMMAVNLHLFPTYGIDLIVSISKNTHCATLSSSQTPPEAYAIVIIILSPTTEKPTVGTTSAIANSGLVKSVTCQISPLVLP